MVCNVSMTLFYDVMMRCIRNNTNLYYKLKLNEGVTVVGSARFQATARESARLCSFIKNFNQPRNSESVMRMCAHFFKSCGARIFHFSSARSCQRRRHWNHECCHGDPGPFHFAFSLSCHRSLAIKYQITLTQLVNLIRTSVSDMSHPCKCQCHMSESPCHWWYMIPTPITVVALMTNTKRNDKMS